jgi:hypothetical protein
MSGYRPISLWAFVIVLTCNGWARGKPVNGLIFQILSEPKIPCLFHPFQIWQKADPFFKDLKQFRKNQDLEYRRGKEVVANFPDSTTVVVAYSGSLTEFNSCMALPPFDPRTVKFRLTWKSDSQNFTANGTYVMWQESAPRPWCEERCAGAWEYELRIDSQNVPLQDSLIVTIEAQNGTRLTEYIGKLSTDNIHSRPLVP